MKRRIFLSTTAVLGSLALACTAVPTVSVPQTTDHVLAWWAAGEVMPPGRFTYKGPAQRATARASKQIREALGTGERGKVIMIGGFATAGENAICFRVMTSRGAARGYDIIAEHVEFAGQRSRLEVIEEWVARGGPAELAEAATA